jgi:hypothetical protein
LEGLGFSVEGGGCRVEGGGFGVWGLGYLVDGLNKGLGSSSCSARFSWAKADADAEERVTRVRRVASRPSRRYARLSSMEASSYALRCFAWLVLKLGPGAEASTPPPLCGAWCQIWPSFFCGRRGAERCYWRERQRLCTCGHCFLIAVPCMYGCCLTERRRKRPAEEGRSREAPQHQPRWGGRDEKTVTPELRVWARTLPPELCPFISSSVQPRPRGADSPSSVLYSEYQTRCCPLPFSLNGTLGTNSRRSVGILYPAQGNLPA